MKRILLASASIVAFAGAAAADGHATSGITFSGSADLGFNDDAQGDNNGFYSDLDIVAGFSAALDNGLVAAASLNLDDIGDGTDDGTVYELSLTSETAGLYYGDTSFAAENVWANAGSMDQDGFSEADGEESIRGTFAMGGFDTQMSYVLANSDGDRNAAESLNQLSIGVSGDFGGVNVVAAYQAESDEAAGFYGSNGDFNDADVFGLSVGTSLAGADVRLAYAESAGEDSMGVSLSYPAGPVTIDASYVVESAGDDNWDLGATYENGPVSFTVATDESDDWKAEGSYDVGNGLTVFAGVADGGEDSYIAATYGLGGGAELLVSFADDGDDDAGDEVGANDYQVGTTVEISFEF